MDQTAFFFQFFSQLLLVVVHQLIIDNHYMRLSGSLNIQARSCTSVRYNKIRGLYVRVQRRFELEAFNVSDTFWKTIKVKGAPFLQKYASPSYLCQRFANQPQSFQTEWQDDRILYFWVPSGSNHSKLSEWACQIESCQHWQTQLAFLVILVTSFGLAVVVWSELRCQHVSSLLRYNQNNCLILVKKVELHCFSPFLAPFKV